MLTKRFADYMKMAEESKKSSMETIREAFRQHGTAIYGGNQVSSEVWRKLRNRQIGVNRVRRKEAKKLLPENSEVPKPAPIEKNKLWGTGSEKGKIKKVKMNLKPEDAQLDEPPVAKVTRRRYKKRK